MNRETLEAKIKNLQDRLWGVWTDAHKIPKQLGTDDRCFPDCGGVKTPICDIIVHLAKMRTFLEPFCEDGVDGGGDNQDGEGDIMKARGEALVREMESLRAAIAVKDELLEKCGNYIHTTVCDPFITAGGECCGLHKQIKAALSSTSSGRGGDE